MCKLLLIFVLLGACSKPETSARNVEPETKPATEVPKAVEPAPEPSAVAQKVASVKPLANAEPNTYLDIPPGSAFNTTVQNAADSELDDGGDELGIYKQVRTRLSVVNACYAKQRKVDPELAGKLTVKMTVAPAPKGAVTSAEVVERSLNDTVVEDCVVARLKSFSFDRQGADPLTVSLPLIFR